MDKKIIIAFVIAILVVLGGIYWASSGRVGGAKADAATTALAQCLTDKGVKMFGAWWCPHCAEQKKLFGDAFKKVNYVECATPDGQGQTQVCKDNKITGYPTWQFPDGSREEGVMPLADLAAKVSCPFPGASSATATTTADIGSSSAAIVGTSTATTTAGTSTGTSTGE